MTRPATTVTVSQLRAASFALTDAHCYEFNALEAGQFEALGVCDFTAKIDGYQHLAKLIWRADGVTVGETAVEFGGVEVDAHMVDPSAMLVDTRVVVLDEAGEPLDEIDVSKVLEPILVAVAGWQDRATRALPTEKPGALGYDEVLAAYEAILKNNPGKALYIGDACAMLDDNGHIYGCPVGAVTDEIDYDGSFDFDESAWNSVRNCWDQELAASQTMSYINNPQFIKL